MVSRQKHLRVPSLDDALAAAEAYSLGSYLGALARGRAIDPAARAAAAAQVARLAGVGKDYVLSNALRIPSYRFRRELLRGSSRIAGRMDSRVAMPDPDTADDAVLVDPSLELLCGPFASAVNDYLRRDLNVTEDLPYWYLNPDVVAAWNWRTGMQASQGYVDVSQKLADALNMDPSLRVFIAAGLYDLTTPYFGAVYTVNHLQIDAGRAGDVVLRTYPAGHMLYTDASVLRRFTRDVSNFYRAR